jgi:uncharacterized protein YqgC (DUF456 family)
MKRHLITAALAVLAFLCALLLAILAVWAYWYVDSWGYNHAPVTPGDPHDAAAYVLIGMEMFIGLPLGLILGPIAGIVVLWRRLAPLPPSP